LPCSSALLPEAGAGGRRRSAQACTGRSFRRLLVQQLQHRPELRPAARQHRIDIRTVRNSGYIFTPAVQRR